MRFLLIRGISSLLLLLLLTQNSIGQINQPATPPGFIKLNASPNYDRSGLYQFFWGKHYRKDWKAETVFPMVNLDTLAGGLTVYQTGGGRQSKSLRLRDKNGREYVLRSIDKTFSGALPEITRGSFVERLANDQVTISNPYSAVVVAPLAEAAGIYHTNPRIVYVPFQKALGQYNDSAGNMLYLFEQRPDENWSTAPNFGNAKNIISTENMLAKLLEDNDNSVDQRLFLRSRLFDMWIGDWGRHEDQWRWGKFEEGKRNIYRPIPRDRDNAFTKFDGILLKPLIAAARAKHLQTFDDNLKKVARFNFPARHLDHHLLNEVTREEWMSIAADLQTRLTDGVIDAAVQKFPEEVYAISGAEIARKLKARRSHLSEWADIYFRFLNEDVEITGSAKSELIEVERINSEDTRVSLYKISKEGTVNPQPIYRRVFKTNETSEIRIYGIDGNDKYNLRGKVDKGIKVRLIGGPAIDHYSDSSVVKGPSDKTKIFDNPGNLITARGRDTDVETSTDSAINAYNYRYFEYNHKGKIPMLFYNNDDRIYVGFGFGSAKYKWRKYPYANTQHIDVKYSLSQKAFSATYFSNFVELLGKWNVSNYANWDQIRWTNYYGLGNESKMLTDERDFHRNRSEEFIVRSGVNRVVRSRHKFYLNGLYQTYKVINDTDRFLAKQTQLNPVLSLRTNQFAGAEIGYVYQNLNDSVLPVKGIAFNIYGSYIDDINRSSGTVGKYGAEATAYLPLTRKFGLVIRGGGTTLNGSPQFFQYNRLGGSETLRGFQRDRFSGNSTVFSQNELRYISNVRGRIMNGKLGVFALFDAGRVFLDGEKSDTWHSSVGGGIIISPFNRLSVSVAYAKSAEDANIHLRIFRPL